MPAGEVLAPLAVADNGSQLLDLVREGRCIGFAEGGKLRKNMLARLLNLYTDAAMTLPRALLRTATDFIASQGRL